jgi:UDP-N-acetylmuramoyl-L-alanyl-D-glutamate--2,6-diaminopimelate ligase
MKSLVRKFTPQSAINYGKHLPTALVANLKYGFPSKKLKVIGVTGTDGKTTTTNMIYQILKSAGKRVSMVSTINAEIAGEVLDTGFHVTNPNPMMLQKFLKRAVKAGDEYLVLEVTSHGLDQFRAWGVNFEIGVVTNITHEHLDYHKTWENYFNAKAKLIKNVKLAVLNRDEEHFVRLSKKTFGKVVSFGTSKNANFNPIKFPLKLKLPGEFNILNALAATAVAVYLDISTKTIKSSLENFDSLLGRMNEVENDKGIRIIVDFAHTPNGLEQALKALKKGAKGKIITLTGAEGYRDEAKRPLMGEIATRLSDTVIFTAVDPRGLQDEINSQMMEGAKKADGELGKNVYIENDRTKAIDLAINKLAQKGDIVGIFGKGHENSMNFDGKKEVSWSDFEAVQTALKSK